MQTRDLLLISPHRRSCARWVRWRFTRPDSRIAKVLDLPVHAHDRATSGGQLLRSLLYAWPPFDQAFRLIPQLQIRESPWQKDRRQLKSCAQLSFSGTPPDRARLVRASLLQLRRARRSNVTSSARSLHSWRGRVGAPFATIGEQSRKLRIFLPLETAANGAHRAATPARRAPARSNENRGGPFVRPAATSMLRTRRPRREPARTRAALPG